MIGTKFEKPVADEAAYAAAAEWCNQNGARIEDEGAYYEVVAVPEPSIEEKLAAIEAAIDAHIASVMQARTYDSITSCITYLGSTNPRWDSDARDALAWRTAVWERAYALLNAWQSGQIDELTTEQVVAQLPKMQWTFDGDPA